MKGENEKRVYIQPENQRVKEGAKGRKEDGKRGREEVREREI